VADPALVLRALLQQRTCRHNVIPHHPLYHTHHAITTPRENCNEQKPFIYI
jgi:hypothetical protein